MIEYLTIVHGDDSFTVVDLSEVVIWRKTESTIYICFKKTMSQHKEIIDVKEWDVIDEGNISSCLRCLSREIK